MPVRPFFSMTELTQVKEPLSKIAQCGACKLDKGCKSPYMPVYGSGRRKIMVIGEAPGKDEDEQNRPFVGKDSQRLRRVLSKHGVDLDVDCWSTNALICRPPDSKIPEGDYIDYCRPNVVKAIEQYKPEVILLTGYYPTQSIIDYVWDGGTGKSIAKWVGWQIPCQKLNAWVCPTYHPSYLDRQEDPVLDGIFDSDIKGMSRLTGRPYQTVPKYDKQVIKIADDREAVDFINNFIKWNEPTAVDYETTTLKPDGPHAKIVSCSLSNGTTTIAFLWHNEPELKKAMCNFWESDVPKIASNLKMEDRWTMRILGVKVRNWRWDTMIAAHVLDNRTEITSIKFQAFALLGQQLWTSGIDGYLDSPDHGGNTPNRIRQVYWNDLLQYNGMDSLMEILVAREQSKQLGFFLEN